MILCRVSRVRQTLSQLSSLKSSKRIRRLDLCASTSKSDHISSALQRIQALCPDHCLSVQSVVRSIQVLVKDALVAMGSSGDGAESLVELQKESEKSRSRLEASLKALYR